MISIIEIYYNINYLGLIEAFFIFISTMSLFLWGYLSDKYSRKRILLIGFAIVIFSNIGMIFADKIEIYILLRVFMGIGIGTISPVSYSLASDFIDINERSTILGGSSVATISGSGIGIILGGVFGDINWQIPFLIIALFFLFLLILFLSIREPIRGEKEPELIELASKNQLNDKKMPLINIKTFYSLFKKKTNLSMMTQGILALIPSAILNYYLINYLSDTRYGGIGLPLIWATILALSSASGRIFGFLIWGYLGDKLQQKYQTTKAKALLVTLTMGLQVPMISFSFFFALPVYEKGNINVLLFILTSSSFLIFMSFFFLGTLLGGASGPNRRSLSFDINEPEARGSISSIFTFADQIGASIGLFIASFLIPTLGYPQTFIAIVVIGYGLAMVLWIPSIFYVENDAKILRKILKDRAEQLKNE
ncbi:MAG: Bacillibactin exporter [Candidatus Heimdallarchaeota archaeon LC_3]|nr:MAG: Bacillibactin exporter [Candidatus Heimdallarchaeota archaeon LC_3]